MTPDKDPRGVAPETEKNEQPTPPAGETPAVEMSDEDQAIVLQRLRELGYVD